MIDELAVAAAHELRGTVASDLDAGLLELHAGHRRRRRNFAAAASSPRSRSLWASAGGVNTR